MKNTFKSELQFIALLASFSFLASVAAYINPEKIAMFKTGEGFKALARGLVLTTGFMNLAFFIFANKQAQNNIISDKSFGYIKLFYYCNTVFLGFYLILISMPALRVIKLHWIEYVFPTVGCLLTVRLYKLFKNI